MVEIHERIGRPDLLPQIVARDNNPGIFKERDQDLKGLFLQTNSHAVLAQLARR